MQENQQSKEAMKEAIKESATLKSERPLSFGEKLVGLTFNPSNDVKVDTAKKLFAQIADLINDAETSKQTGLGVTLFQHTVGEILNAQMNVVKLLTLKY